MKELELKQKSIEFVAIVFDIPDSEGNVFKKNRFNYK